MKKVKGNKTIILMVIASMVLMAIGCATVKKGVDQPVISGITGAIPTATSTIPSKSYLVKKGDCFWKISAKKSVYGDPFMWWAIYKANRCEIGDNPNIIQVKTKLSIQRGIDKDETDACKEEAYRYEEK
jgi:hypothetical protein